MCWSGNRKETLDHTSTYISLLATAPVDQPSVMVGEGQNFDFALNLNKKEGVLPDMRPNNRSNIG